MPTAHITHTTRLPRFLTAAAASAAALAATAPFASADEIWSSTQTIDTTKSVTGMLTIEGAAPGPIVNVATPGSISISSFIFIGRTNANKATLNITANATVTSGNNVSIGEESGSEGKVTVSGENAILHSTGDILIGNTGYGVFEISGGGNVYNDPDKNISIGTASGGAGGKVTVSGKNSSLSSSKFLNIGNLANATLEISDGGSVSSGSNAYIGLRGDATTTVSGKDSTLTVGAWLYIGVHKKGTLDISDGAVVTGTTQTHVGGNSEFGDGTLNLLTGGTLATKLIQKGVGTATLNFNGGTIRALADQTNFFKPSSEPTEFGVITLNNANLPAGAPALIFNTNGYNVTSSDSGGTTFGGPGGLTKTGSGTLIITGAHTYTGTTTVSGGAESVLKVAGTLYGGLDHTGDIVLVGGSKIIFNPTGEQKFSGVLSGTGTVGFDIAKSVIVAGTLNPGAGSTPGELTFQGATSVTLAASAQFVVDLKALDGADANDLLIVNGGNLVLDGAQLVIRRGAKFPLWGAKGGSEIVIAKVVESGAKIEGMFANVDEKKFVTDATGRRALVSIRANTEGGQDLLLTMFPEPSTYALLGGTGVLLLALFRRRRRTRQRTGNAGL
jgi:T5SS/PEP-CTERM-associated repeat protein/autotransporter-associated beta strand protein